VLRAQQAQRAQAGVEQAPAPAVERHRLLQARARPATEPREQARALRERQLAAEQPEPELVPAQVPALVRAQ
jgi:hypothetical protein